MKDVKEELNKHRKHLVNLLQKRDYDKLAKKLTSICIQFCPLPTLYDRSIFTPYEKGSYALQGYVNYSEIVIFTGTETKKYIAAAKPKHANIENFRCLIRHCDLVISCINSINYLSDPIKSTPLQFKGKVVFYDEIYEDVRVLRFTNWIDHDVIQKDEWNMFYAYYKNINATMPLIHCFAGVGRTGFFILYDILHGKKVSSTEFIDLLIDLRSQRNGLVYSAKQIKCLSEWFVSS